jgi:Zn-dependent peptidase ImmA (M78 family)
MSLALKIKVNPRVLQWAREESGFSVEDIANKIQVKPDRYLLWETQGNNIPFSKLKDLAKQYKRQIAVFFLPTPPPKIKKPKDYRNLAISQRGLSRETLLAVRRTYKYLQLSKEVNGTDFYKNEYSWINEVEKLISNSNLINITLFNWLRIRLNFPIEDQIKLGTYYNAFRNWRNLLEQKLGIFIFQFSLPENELDGFSYFEGEPPYAIVLNSNVSPSRKIFTIFHELGHIFKQQSGICLPDFKKNEHQIEFECNEFAGKFLVPDQFVFKCTDLDEISEYAKKYKVSSEVYLRRNFEQGFIDRNVFFKHLNEIRANIPPKKKPEGFAIKPQIKSKSARGEMFYNLVLEAVYNNKIEYTTASDVLDMGVNYILNE